MHTLARLHGALSLGVIHETNLVAENATGIHHHTCPHLIIAARFDIREMNTTHEAVCFCETSHAGMVQHASPVVNCRSRQSDRESSIVELTVKILHASKQVLRLNIWNPSHRLLSREQMRRRKVQLARQSVINLESDAEKWSLPPLVAGHDERQVVHEMRRVAVHESTFAQGLQDERDVTLLEITNPAMHELGATAGCAFRKIRGLEKDCAEAACGGIHRDPETGCPAANDGNIPLGRLFDLLQKFFSIHSMVSHF